MVLKLDALWFGVLILVMAAFCTAPLISAQVFWALILLFIAGGLALTIVSQVNERRKVLVPVSDDTRLLEFLRAHGITGKLSQAAESLGIAEERALEIMLSLEAKGDIPPGSSKMMWDDLGGGETDSSS
ncbi:MAG TPA: hypothetical protein VMW64_02600 [Dehalococcoidia bacterium]|nr:hypothetical protein [Dehalococcoidia bacterium]